MSWIAGKVSGTVSTGACARPRNVLDCFIAFCIILLVASNALRIDSVLGTMEQFSSAFSSVLAGQQKGPCRVLQVDIWYNKLVVGEARCGDGPACDIHDIAAHHDRERPLLPGTESALQRIFVLQVLFTDSKKKPDHRASPDVGPSQNSCNGFLEQATLGGQNELVMFNLQKLPPAGLVANSLQTTAADVMQMDRQAPSRVVALKARIRYRYRLICTCIYICSYIYII